jgi:hypothetical protein
MKNVFTYHKRHLLHLTILTCFVSFPISVHAQNSPQFYDYPQNHLPWFTLESNHFLVHYQEGNSRSAQVASVIAEEVYEPITSLYGHKPRRKVSIVLRDREDFSNGAAFFFDDKIEIWVPALDTPLRGTHNWFWNVIAHEFTHIVQLGASMKRTQRVPAIYFQWLSYEDVRRPDVLYGFPNGIITKPFASVSIPAWFAEGTAQYQRSGMEYDYWDSHRDMLLRTRILSDTYLTFTEMGMFSSKNTLEREAVYNQGFGFTIYLVSRFGEQVVADISRKASQSRSNNFSKVIEMATGISGEVLFKDWIDDRKKHYSDQLESLNPTESKLMEEDGFFNFYPQYSSNGEFFAYLSNRGRDYGRTALILKRDDETIEIDDMGGPDLINRDQSYLVSHGLTSNPALDFISNRFSFSADGKQIAYSRARKNRYGETYQDVYLFDIEQKESRKVTESARIQDPAWHPENDIIAAVQQQDGTQNLIILNLEDGTTVQLTGFDSGETIYTPVWHPNGKEIYFASASMGSRNIYRFHLEERVIEPVFTDRYIDFRDPWIDNHGASLYFSSNQTGIFNIYQKNLENSAVHQITDVTGGAFMPFINNDSLYTAEYFTEGYKITRMEMRRGLPVTLYTNPSYRELQNRNRLETSVTAFEPGSTPSRGEVRTMTLETDHGLHEMAWQPYSETTTGLSVFPVLRFDNYTKLRGSNSSLLGNAKFGSIGENLWRDMKAGAYFSSRDVTENISIFGGALLGLGSIPAEGVADFISPSRLNNLDRDLFLIVEHRGLPFIKRSWSPTISVELYNLKRNVRDGITIEEFACTSCLPEERSIDIRYSIWEANLFLRSKLNRWSLLELGASYSPYSVSTEGFFSNEFNEFIPGSTSEYFRGSTFSASYIAELTEPARHFDIAPVGFKGSFTYRYQPGRLLQQFEIEDGVLSPVYSRDYNHSLELRSRFGVGLNGDSAAMITTRGFTYLNTPDQFFYLDYTGGLAGMRSYPYFAIGGRTTMFARASWLSPIYQSLNRQIGAYTIDKIFGHLFIETGNGWGGPLDIGNNFKTGLGAELRFAFNSHFLFPMKFFMNGTYGVNRFDVTLPSQFITPESGNTVRYGREILFYFGLTFDFDLL